MLLLQPAVIAVLQRTRSLRELFKTSTTSGSQYLLENMARKVSGVQDR
jgi:hypothetical protein